MRALSLALLGVLALAGAAAAQASLAGRLVADVTAVTTDGATVDAAIVELIETRIGEPLEMTAVRDTIDHLVGLGRYDDVRLLAEPAGDDRVRLRWVLRPVRLVTRIEVSGGPLSASLVRGAIDDRFGAAPRAALAVAMAEAAAEVYRDRGYRSARVTPAIEAGDAEGEVGLRLEVDAGPRTTMATTRVVGTPTEPASAVIDALRLQPGRPYDRQALDARVAAYENRLRSAGYYEATVRATTEFSDADARATVEVAVEPGPRVRIVYAGDAVPGGSLESLVPVREERSVDEDLLEDASRNIGAYLRERGFRDAAAPYTRETRGGELVITFTVSRGPLHRVAGASVVGNLTVPTAQIEPLLKLPRGEPFVDARVAAIAAAIEELYRVRGYGQARVAAAVEVLPEQAGDGRYRPVEVRFTIAEGPRTMVAGITVTGAGGTREAGVRAALGLAEGRPFYRPLLAADLDAVERFYRNLGFLSARVVPEVTFSDDRREARVDWTIAEGEQSRVDRLLITGNERTSADVIRRELRIAEGDPLGAEAIAESQRRLSQLGLFRRVRIVDLPRTGTPRRDVLVTVEEAPATGITYGGGLEVGRRLRPGSDGAAAEERVEVAPRGFLELSRRNLWGKNRTLSFFSRVSLRPRDPEIGNLDPTDTGGYGFNDYRVTGTFREPRAFGTAGDAQVTAFLERGIRASFNFDRRGVRADYARRFSNRLTLTGRYTYDYTELFDEQIAAEDRLLIDRLFPQVRLSTFFGALLRDSRDDVLDPQRGTVLGLDGSLAARAWGSEVGFAKTFMQGFAYRRLPGPGFVIASGLRLGLATGFPREVPRLGSDGLPVVGPDGQPVVDIVEDLPASERFFAGGDTTIRGFALDRLGAGDTLDQQGFPRGGNGLIVLNAELRAPYWKGLGLVGFVDAGNVYRRAADIDLSDLRVATGFGLRYRSPIGPLRIDLGFKVNPQLLASGSRERRSIVHISLGQAF